MIEALFSEIPDRVERAVNIVKGKKKTEWPEVKGGTKG
jgi:hypothetical protein